MIKINNINDLPNKLNVGDILYMDFVGYNKFVIEIILVTSTKFVCYIENPCVAKAYNFDLPENRWDIENLLLIFNFDNEAPLLNLYYIPYNKIALFEILYA